MGNPIENSKRWEPGEVPPDAHLTPEQLSAWLEGDCSPSELTAVASHLASCAQCRDEKAALELLLTDFRALPELDAPPAFVTRVLERVEAEAPSGVLGVLLHWLGLSGPFRFSKLVPIAAPLAVAVLAVVMVRRPESDEVSMPALEKSGGSVGLELPPGAESEAAQVPAAPAADSSVGSLNSQRPDVDPRVAQDKTAESATAPLGGRSAAEPLAYLKNLPLDGAKADLDLAGSVPQGSAAKDFKRPAREASGNLEEKLALQNSGLLGELKPEGSKESAGLAGQQGIQLRSNGGGGGASGEGVGGIGTLGGIGKGGSIGMGSSGYGVGGDLGSPRSASARRGTDEPARPGAHAGADSSEEDRASAGPTTTAAANKPSERKELQAPLALPKADQDDGYGAAPASQAMAPLASRSKTSAVAAPAPAMPVDVSTREQPAKEPVLQGATGAAVAESGKKKAEKSQSVADMMAVEARSRDVATEAETVAVSKQAELAKQVPELFRFARPDAIIVLELKAGVLAGLTSAVQEVGGQVGPQLVRENGRGRIPIILPRGAYPRLIEKLRARGSLGATPPPERPNAERVWVELEPPT